MRIRIDFKTAIAIGALIFTGAAFYVTTTQDIKHLSTEISELKAEHKYIQRRLDSLHKKFVKKGKRLKGAK